MLDHFDREQATFRPGTAWNRSTRAGAIDPSRRDCLTLRDPTSFAALFLPRMREIVPIVLAELGISEPAIGALELEASSYGDGGHFHTHIDTLESADRVRIVSCVYYVASTPRRFTGGELRLHGFPGGPGAEVGVPVDVPPDTDTLVAFPSWMRHEVLPVRLSSDRWRDRRFAINCWVHRAPAEPDKR